MKNERSFGINLGKIVLGDSNFLELSEPTMIVARKESILECIASEIVTEVKRNFAGELRVFSFGKSLGFEDATFLNEAEIKKGLVEIYNYIKTVNTFLKFNKCKNIFEYNRKFRNQSPRVVVLLNGIERYKRLGNYSEIEPLIRFVVGNANSVGVVVVATTTGIENIGVGEELFFKFNNRLIFGGVDERTVEKLTLGMYNSTTNLEDGEFYYMTGNLGNGSKIVIYPENQKFGIK